MPIRSPRYGNVSTPPSTRQSNGLPLSGLAECAHAQHPADVQHLDDVAGLDVRRHVTRIAEQRLAVTQRTDDDIALAHLGHPAAGEFERVVVGLVGQHLNHHHHAFLGRNIGRDAHLRVPARRPGVIEAIFVDDDASSPGRSRPKKRTGSRRPGRRGGKTRRAVKQSSKAERIGGGVHSPAALDVHATRGGCSERTGRIDALDEQAKPPGRISTADIAT